MSDSVGQVIGELERLGVRMWVESGQLKFRAPQGVMTDDRRAELRTWRDEIVEHLAAGGMPQLRADLAGRFEPFPITDVQSAYLLGRGRTFAYGGVACHGYGELRYPELDPARMTTAWRALIARHDMLRAVVEVDGSQRVLPDVPDYQVAVTDVRGRPDSAVLAAVEANRAEMDHRVFQHDRWPLFEARITLGDTEAVMHVSVDFLIADFVSLQVLLDELHRLYHSPDQALPPLDINFRDYLLAERRWTADGRHDRDREYWLSRVDDVPAAPELPTLASAADSPGRFRRFAATLDEPLWTQLRRRAGQHDVSPSGAVLAAYVDTIAAWSRRPSFTLNVTLLNRLPLHPQVPALIGDFTGVELLAVNGDPGASFAERAKAVQAQLWQDMDHRTFTGVEVMREITRRRGAEAALFPVVLTSAIGLADNGDPETAMPMGELGYGISQTPQVWIDCQNMERDGTLATNWDVREGVFADGVVDDMFAAYEALLRRLATQDEAWAAPHRVELPAAQAQRRAAVNDTIAPMPQGRLHDGVLAQARRYPDRIAVIAGDRTLTYGELAAHAFGIADRLRAAGCARGDLVAVTMDRGWEQIPAVLGALLAGAAYVPVDTNSPAPRRAQILASAGARYVLTVSSLFDAQWPDSVELVAVDTVASVDASAREITGGEPGDLAYVIHTSGSTGAPKGVMITHKSALNTVVDINERFGVGPGDRVLGLSQLGFDLSVYDIFGPLAVGGALVIPRAERRADPSHWAELIVAHQVSIWNSVPAQLQMLTGYLASTAAANVPTLRLAMLSGDWIPVGLPDQIRAQVPELELISLGGATEASIWSIYHPIGEVRADLASIPYGKPLVNQTFHVLNSALEPCPDWVTGELYIGGVGVAQGYLNDAERTAERFIIHPVTGDRLYRTGDLGRYLPDGNIEFLGREDFQVKIRGYRIELAEIETALQSHPGVAGAVVLVDGDRPLERRLAAFVEPARLADGAGEPAAMARLLESVGAAANAAGDAAIDGVDRDRYLTYAHRLDQVALPAMVLALQSGGLFTEPDDRHTLAEILAGAKIASRHHRLLRRWLRSLTTEHLLDCDDEGRYRLRTPVSQSTVDEAWAQVLQAAQPQDSGLLEYFRASIDQLPALLRGDDDPLALLFPDGRLDVSQRLYEDALFNQWANSAAGAVVRELAQVRIQGSDSAEPRPLRVLEVGAGGGGTTAAVLQALAGTPIDYLCTDLSPYFTGQQQARFGQHEGVRFGVYDLDADFRRQGLAPNSFDLIVAGDVLHATGDVDRVLGELRQLLVPGGWVVALEMTRDHYQIMTSLELLVRLDEATGDFTDQRQGTDQVFLDRQSWLDALHRAGAGAQVCLPEPETFVGQMGMCVLAAKFKTDRAAVDAAGLTAHLRERLPEYMVPPVVQVLDTLPVTDNGKIDRRALKALLPRQGATAAVKRSGPASDLENRLALMWSEALNVAEVGRDGNLFELGGDSLVAAQLAGRILEELPEARELFFDELLRNLLEQPTVAQLAEWIVEAAAASPVDEQRPAGRPADVLVPLTTTGPGVPRIFLHDATGSLGGLGDLVAAFGDDAPAWGLTGAGLDGLPAIDRVAATFSQAIIEADHAQVHLLGYGHSALLAVEVARSLTERGVLVEGVTLVSGRRPNSAVEVAVAYVADTGAEPEADSAGWDTFTRLHTALAGFDPAIYAGDLLLVRSTDDTDADLAFWEDICLGDLVVVEVDATAVELRGPAHAEAVVKAAAAPGGSR